MNYEVATRGADGEAVVLGLVEVAEGEYEITLDGETFHVGASQSSRAIYSLLQDGRQYEAMVDEVGTHGFDVLIAGQLLHLEAIDERTKLLAASAAPIAAGKQSVEAEMPGKVVKLHVAEGDAVAQGAGVLVLEAMKMENEIPSPIAGIVTEIDVSEGETVEGGKLLFVVEPPDPD